MGGPQDSDIGGVPLRMMMGPTLIFLSLLAMVEQLSVAIATEHAHQKAPLSNKSYGLWNRTIKTVKPNSSPICELFFCYFLRVMES